MARLNVTGMDSLVADLELLGRDVRPVMDRMAQAGADVVAEERRKEAKRRGIERTGSMIRNIKAVKPRGNDTTGRRVVYSQGKDKNGTRNAEKEFLEHYGYRGRSGSHWIDSAEAKARNEAGKAMENVFDDFIDGSQ